MASQVGGALANIENGAVKVTLGANVLGFTSEGVDVDLGPEWNPVQVDEYGETWLDAMHNVSSVEVTMRLTEHSIDQLNRIMEGSLKSTSGPDSKVSVGKSEGFRASTTALQLRLHPIFFVTGDSDKSRDLVIHKAFVLSGPTYSYTAAETRIYEVVFKGLVDPTHFEMAADGWLWIVDKNADPKGLGKQANVPTGTLWRLSPDHQSLEIVATGPPLRAPACVRFAGGIAYLLDADAFRTEPISHEGAIFKVAAAELETVVRLQGLLSPISMQVLEDHTFLVVDVNADPQQPNRYWGAVYLVNPADASTTLFCHDPAFRDPASATLIGNELLLVDASADPKAYGKDDTGQGYGGFGRGAVFRIDLAQRRAHLACASKQFVNPVRVEVLQR